MQTDLVLIKYGRLKEPGNYLHMNRSMMMLRTYQKLLIESIPHLNTLFFRCRAYKLTYHPEEVYIIEYIIIRGVNMIEKQKEGL